MIQTLSTRYSRPIAFSLSLLFYAQFFGALCASARENTYYPYVPGTRWDNRFSSAPVHGKGARPAAPPATEGVKRTEKAIRAQQIGGPSSPEASSFKAVGSDNLVNLFTGDFSYSVPLLDVGGYPVNLFYSGGIGMEQEASWVGLGWNINPGSVSRNMRGVPDDFDGSDKLLVTQNVKPNRTLGGEVGGDFELTGYKIPSVGISMGVSYNNYLGPELTMGTSASLNLLQIQSIKFEKAAPDSFGVSLNLGISEKLSSRSGFTLTPSLNAKLSMDNSKAALGTHLSTSYNSRSGIKTVNLSSEMSFYKEGSLKWKGQDGKVYTSTYHKDWSNTVLSSSISFARPSYLPSIRMPMRNRNYSGQFELGLGDYGVRGSVRVSGYYTESMVPASAREVQKPLVGFLYLEKALNDQAAIMDFNRINDAEITPHTPVISAPQYNYDVFSIQGEGTGGTIRAYRGNSGFMKDNKTVSTDDNFDLGFDMAPSGHFGLNLNDIYSPSIAGSWENNNLLTQAMAFEPRKANSAFENVYFRNPGEITVVNPQSIDRVGGDALVRYELSGSNVNPRLDTRVHLFDRLTTSDRGITSLGPVLQKREKRTQVVNMLTAGEASMFASNRVLRNYSGNLVADTLEYSTIPRVSDYRKAHHISEIDVLEQSGMRYEFGLPVYNKKQSDFTFSVNNTPNPATNIVEYDTDDPTTDSRWMRNSSRIDGYVQIQRTPAYASAFLLTGLLSPDYVDVTNDGITDDDLGTAVRFNYALSSDTHKWRTPRGGSAARTAHFNAGIKTEKRDNKASVSYGEREVWYLSSIESKTMVALFKTADRKDAKGVISDMDGTINSSEKANKRLDQIDLYTKAELRAHPTHPIPVKTVHFEYNYTLCPGTPDAIDSGKLTLVAVSFSYNGQSRARKDRYVFNYGNPAVSTDNPAYAVNASDRWGTYKPASSNPGGLTNSDYPFAGAALNDAAAKQQLDQQAGAWSLKKILLPSGGQMEVTYESDDYGYVQDRRACNMMALAGTGTSSSLPVLTSGKLYGSSEDPMYVYVHLPQPLASSDPVKARQEIQDRYLDGLKQLSFKLAVQMPKGEEIINSYALFDDFGLCPNSTDQSTIFIHLSAQGGKSPLALASTGFLINNIPGQAFDGYDVDVDGLQAFVEIVGGMLSSLKNAFTEVDEQVRGRGLGKFIALDRSFVRLANPYRMRYGGGVRVKKVVVKDNWNKMTGQYLSTYGQEYDYTKKEMVNGVETDVSSGVASYEPSIGSEENPFREILSFTNKLPLSSAQYGTIEMPILDALYPSPCVGYSKVTVRSIHRKGTHSDSTLRSSIGKQVTEFYTARDFPTISNYTPFQDVGYHKKPPFSFFYKMMIDQRALSQGFLVQTNDMHGKMKAQLAYSERDEKTPLSASYHTYRNTGANGMNDKVNFVYNAEGGIVRQGNLGIDMELMTDVRDFKALSEGLNVQLQVDLFYFPFGAIPFPTLYPLKSHIENNYRAVTCTKLINYHAIEDSVTVMDKGSVITTRTIAYDAETGQPIVTQTANEFNDPVYKVNYPAHWAYKGIGPAYVNMGMQFTGVNFTNGTLGSPASILANFESGDELYVTNAGAAPGDCIDPSPATVQRLWVFDKRKNGSALQSGAPQLVFIDADGVPYHRNGVSFRIVRSGHRNNLGSTVAEATTLKNPLQGGYLVLNDAAQVVAASAVEYKEKWGADWEVFGKHTLVTTECASVEVEDCNGYLDKRINPYLKGLVGTLRPWRSLVYYGNRSGTAVGVSPVIRRDGVINGFAPYWAFDGASNLQPQVSNTNWVWNSELTKVNAKGQELETRDALNVYTSAQYGYNKSLPVAVTKNARSGGAAFDGFEDYVFQDVLNNSEAVHCPRRHIDFPDSLGFHLVDTDTSSFAAHSGHYVVRVNSGSVVKPIRISTMPDTFNLRFPQTSKGLLQNLGANISLVNITGSDYTITASGGAGGYWGHGVVFKPDTICIPNDEDLYPTSVKTKGMTVKGIHFIQAAVCDDYIFEGSQSSSGGFGCTSTDSINVFNAAGEKLSVVAMTNDPTTIYWTYHLVPGIYRVESIQSAGGHKLTPCDNQCGVPGSVARNPCLETAQQPVTTCGYSGIYNWTVKCHPSSNLSVTLPAYVNDETGCNLQAPIAASDSMVNPAFSFTPGSKMLFSAWVREGCTGANCGENGYANNTIQLAFTGAGSLVTLRPSGTVIEGWQRYEAAFTVPANATGVTLTVNNTGAAPLYLDDLRLHPYNANMKSYVYDTHSLRLSAELDENNYASYYEYDEEGQLVRVKKETVQGIKTIRETRSAKQKAITDVQ